MAKGTISKGKKAPSVHSRAARRATSPGIDTDKSLKAARPPQESVDRRPAVLAAHHSGGVTKKKTKTGRKAVPSTRARRRAERSADRAEAVMDRTALKVARSKGHVRVIHARKKTWDDINREAFGEKGEGQQAGKVSKKARAKMEEDEMVAAFYADADGDEEMEGAEDVSGEEEEGGMGAVPVQPVAVPGAAAGDDEEEIL